MEPFFTTHVGSLPRPAYLLAAFREFTEGKLAIEEYERILRVAVRSAVEMQVQAGIDEVNDGEYGRLVYFGDLTGLPGFAQNMFPLEFSAGDVYRAPLIAGKIDYVFDKPIAALEVQRVKEVLAELKVKRRIKVTVPSPTHLAYFYPDPKNPFVPPAFAPYIQRAFDQVKGNYPSLEIFLDEVNAVIVSEVEAAFKAGADSVQFDSPDLSTIPADRVRWAIDQNNMVLQKFPKEKLELHICWGNYENTQLATTGSFRNLQPQLYDLKVGTLGPLEIFDGLRDFKELGVFKEVPPPSDMRLCAGIVSVKTRNVEPVQALKERYQALVDIVGADNAVASPGCGFASAGESRIISLESAKRKLTNLATAVKEVREVKA